LIAISTHGRTGLGRWAFGSVAKRIMRATAIPVLLIRPTGKA
jgi:nucleotide-binding universal stress UspA family protein